MTPKLKKKKKQKVLNSKVISKVTIKSILTSFTDVFYSLGKPTASSHVFFSNIYDYLVQLSIIYVPQAITLEENKCSEKQLPPKQHTLREVFTLKIVLHFYIVNIPCVFFNLFNSPLRSL